MTVREKKIAEVNEYLEKTRTIDYHCKPVEGIDSGRGGKTYEALVKLALGNYRFKGITAKELRVDTRIKVDGELKSIEIKSNAFEIARLDENGNTVYSIANNDYIIYAPELDLEAPVELQSYVIPAELFINELENAGCIRYKMTSPMIARKKAGLDCFYDRLSIQNNSLKKLNAIYDILDTYGVSLKEFIAQLDR